jgi:1,4-dihydroxy-2-naphthoyl-CoA hydrolase
MTTLEQSVFIRFEDADPAGVIFYPRAIAIAHAVIEELIRCSPLGWNAWFASPTHAAPIRRAEAEFFHPLRTGEKVTARANVESLGETSVVFVVTFLNADHAVAAHVRTVHVLIDRSTGHPVPLTPEIRAALS